MTTPRSRQPRRPRQRAGTSGTGQPVSAPAPITRKAIVDMTPAEFESWAAARRNGLQTFVEEAQRYINRRGPEAAETRTNKIYTAFFSEAADLLAALEEMRAAAEKEIQQP